MNDSPDLSSKKKHLLFSLKLTGFLMLASVLLTLCRYGGILSQESVERVLGVLLGLVIAAYGNAIPKLTDTPASSIGEATTAQSIRRVSGWALTIGFLLSAGLWGFAPRDIAQWGSIVCSGLTGSVMIGFACWKYLQCRGKRASDVVGSTLLLVLLSHSTATGFSQNPDVNFPLATPESQGVSIESIRQITNEAQAYVENGTVIGSELLIVKNRKTILHEAYGFRDRENATPMARNSIFNIRSMTKPLTGIAMQILADEGKLSLQDSVATYLPGFANDKAMSITIEQILQHRGGLPLTILSQRVDEFSTLQDQAKAIGERGPEFPPGEKFWYSDAGSDAAAAIVEVVTGKSIDQFVTESILFPLAMRDSFYIHKANAVAGRDPRMDRVCSLYIGRRANAH